MLLDDVLIDLQASLKAHCQLRLSGRRNQCPAPINATNEYTDDMHLTGQYFDALSP